MSLAAAKVCAKPTASDAANAPPSEPAADHDDREHDRPDRFGQRGFDHRERRADHAGERRERGARAEQRRHHARHVVAERLDGRAVRERRARRSPMRDARSSAPSATSIAVDIPIMNSR